MSTKKSTAVSRYNVMATFGGGRAGNVRLVNKGQKTYIRAAHNSVVNNPQTVRQMKTRLMFASRSQYWEILKPIVEGCMNGITPSVSNANLFNRLNKQVGCYFTKEEMQYKPSVIMPLQITNGSLGAITMTDVSVAGNPNAKFLVEEIKYTDGTPFYAETVGHVSEVLLNENKWLRAGDKITAVVFTCDNSMVAPDGNKIPRVEIKYHVEMVIDPLAGGMPCPLYCMAGVIKTGSTPTNLGFELGYVKRAVDAVAVIVSRNENGKRSCTSSTITSTSYDLMNDHKTSDALNKARTSYISQEKEIGSANAETMCEINWVLDFVNGTTATQKAWIEANMPKRLPSGNQKIQLYTYDKGAMFKAFEGETFDSSKAYIEFNVIENVTLHATMEYEEHGD